MTTDEIAAVFAPHLVETAAGVANGDVRLAHYTRAESAYKIIAGKQVWLRNSLLMNDFSEISHGINCLTEAWASPAGINLRDWLDRTRPGLHAGIAKTFDDHTHGLRSATFMLSLSIHRSDEDDLGRLSMWRAYGGDTGVALVFNPTVFSNQTGLLGMASAPVSYRSVPDFVAWFATWVDGLVSAEAALATLDDPTVLDLFFRSCRGFALCTKHPGFREEREWRVFHSPLLEEKSDWLTHEVEIIGGVPQEVVKVSLRDDPTQGVIGLAPVTLLNRVIIGPCDHPVPITHALFRAMQAGLIPDPHSIMRVSNIPLRRS